MRTRGHMTLSLPRATWLASTLAILGASGCAPRLEPLRGVPAPAVALPRAELPAGHHQVVFDWTLTDPDLTVRGEGVARVAAPDSARLDFFVGGGMGGGWAVLTGDSLRAPGGAFVERVIPPAPLLWAGLGRLALPPTADTTVHVEGELVRADLGTPVEWRVTFRSDSLVRVERVADGRVVEWLDRADSRVRYRHETSRRELVLTITRSQSTPAFDESIWVP